VAASLALLAAVCCAPLAQPGWYQSHEEIRPIARALAAYQEIAAGELYPRWLSSGYLGKGVPLFEFYSPGFSLLVAYAHALGVPLLLAAKGTIFLLFLSGALGTFHWVRRHLGAHAALAAAILYLFAPYHFVDAYVRGALAELTALAVYPWMFFAIDEVAERATARALAAATLASAAVVVSHFLAAWMITPFAVAYAAWRTARAGGLRALGRVAGGGALGAALSAFYWLPALAEQGALSPERREAAFTGFYAAVRHLVHPAQWLDPAWGFGDSIPDSPHDEMSFQVGLLLLGAVAATVLAARWLEAPARRFVLGAAALGAGALLLTGEPARPLYASLGALRLVQFPWRYLGVAVLFLSAAGAGFVAALAPRRAWLGPAAAAGVAALALALSAQQRTVRGVLAVHDDRRAIEAAVEADPWSARFGNVDEYLPRWASVEGAASIPGGRFPSGLGVELGAVRPGPSEVTFEVRAPLGDGLVIVPWHYFPGWRLTLDGRAAPLAPGPDGLLEFVVPQGRHVAYVRFGTTPSRVAGWALAAAALGVLGAASLLERRRRGARG
jgi:hypothetical protein